MLKPVPDTTRTPHTQGAPVPNAYRAPELVYRKGLAEAGGVPAGDVATRKGG